MLRCLSISAVLLSLALTLGCGSSAEVKPDEELTPQVDEAEIQKQIEEGMKMGGMDQYKDKMPSPEAGESPDK